MFLATLLHRLTALLVMLALGAPAWTVCRSIAASEPMAGMPCCQHSDEATTGTVAGDCCTVQQDDPASSPASPAPSALRIASVAVVITASLAVASASHESRDRRAEAEGRGRPKTVPHLLDSVLLI
jgi:hypothetical protein